MDTGLLIIRLVVGLVMAAHGVQKISGWLDGPDVDEFTVGLQKLGYRPARAFRVLLGVTEALGGLGMVFGLLTPLTAAAVVAAMAGATILVQHQGA